MIPLVWFEYTGTLKAWNKQISLAMLQLQPTNFLVIRAGNILKWSVVKGETLYANSFALTRSWHCRAVVSECWEVQICPYVLSVYSCEMCPRGPLHLVIKRLRICYVYIALNIVALRLVLAHSWSCCVACIVICCKKATNLVMSPPCLIITKRAVGCLLPPLNVVKSIKETFVWVDTSWSNTF